MLKVGVGEADRRVGGEAESPLAAGLSHCKGNHAIN